MIGTLVEVSLRALFMTVPNPIFLAELGMIYFSYCRETDKENARLLTLRSAAEGMAAGGLMMMITAGLGILIKPDPAVLFVGPAAWLLSLADRRFFCFSYGAACVVSLCRILRIPIDGTGIAVLVGLLHFAEGGLVWHSGKRGRILRVGQRKGRLYTQSKLFRLWPVPLGLLITAAGGGLTMPGWWPLMGDGGSGSYGLLPLAVTLGYEDPIKEQEREKEQTHKAGLKILLYGAFLLIGGTMAAKEGRGEWIVLLWMVLGHEWIMHSSGRIREVRRRDAG